MENAKITIYDFILNVFVHTSSLDFWLSVFWNWPVEYPRKDVQQTLIAHVVVIHSVTCDTSIKAGDH